MENFSVIWRNYGHWDVYQKDGRSFRIRGGPGKYWVSDERPGHSSKVIEFKTMILAMAFICDELMFELIVAEGQEYTTIERWNV